MEGASRPARVHVLDTGSTMTATAAATERAAEAFELEAEVSLTASAPSLEAERIVTTAATAADAMTVINAIGIMTATATTTVTTAADAATGAAIVEDRIVDTRPMRSMITSRSLSLRAMDRLSLSGGRRLRRGGITEDLQLGAAR